MLVANITPSNTVPFSSPCRAIYVGVSGDVTVVVNGVQVTFTAVPAGTFLPIIATQVMATGTTATNMIFLQ